MNWYKFNSILTDNDIRSAYQCNGDYTYIAKSDDGRVYKIGFTRTPKTRASSFSGDYRKFHFRLTHLFPGNIEHILLWALTYGGAQPAVREAKTSRCRECFYLHPRTLQAIIRRCHFRPIEEFEL